MDLATVIGVLLATLALLGTNALDGGNLSALLQPTAALVVLGGTAGAVAIQFPTAALTRATAEVLGLVRRTPVCDAREETIQLFVAMAGHVQRKGVRILVGVAETLDARNTHLQRALLLVAEQTPVSELREALEIEIERAQSDGEQPIRVLSAAGGYAPTMGILGAVLGLIHVMRNIGDPSRLGAGIAVAFVATVYGLASANMILLPLAGRLRERLSRRLDNMELIAEGACSLAAQQDPHLLAHKLRAFGGPSRPQPPGRRTPEDSTVAA